MDFNVCSIIISCYKGWLGKCEPNSCSGNGGLSDLVAALKMLSNILPSFGADPAAVTLLGWYSIGIFFDVLKQTNIM
jgi:hypothetical protein